MTIEATAHSRQLIARRQLQVFDRAVALRTTDVPRYMARVVEAQIWFG